MSREGAGDMADELQIGSGSIKRRNPWGVVLLAIVTLGIYRWVWYYMINREIRDHSGASIRWSTFSQSRSAGSSSSRRS